MSQHSDDASASRGTESSREQRPFLRHSEAEARQRRAGHPSRRDRLPSSSYALTVSVRTWILQCAEPNAPSTRAAFLDPSAVARPPASRAPVRSASTFPRPPSNSPRMSALYTPDLAGFDFRALFPGLWSSHHSDDEGCESDITISARPARSPTLSSTGSGVLRETFAPVPRAAALGAAAAGHGQGMVRGKKRNHGTTTTKAHEVRAHFLRPPRSTPKMDPDTQRPAHIQPEDGSLN